MEHLKQKFGVLTHCGYRDRYHRLNFNFHQSLIKIYPGRDARQISLTRCYLIPSIIICNQFSVKPWYTKVIQVLVKPMKILGNLKISKSKLESNFHQHVEIL